MRCRISPSVAYSDTNIPYFAATMQLAASRQAQNTAKWLLKSAAVTGWRVCVKNNSGICCETRIFVPSLKNTDWIIEKKRVFVCGSDGSKKRRRTVSGPSYHSGVSLNRSDTEQIWNHFQAFAGVIGLDEVERIPANEQELGRYDFRASNSQTADSFTCLIYLPGEWNQAGVHISVFIGPRYRDADLHKA